MLGLVGIENALSLAVEMEQTEVCFPSMCRASKGVLPLRISKFEKIVRYRIFSYSAEESLDTHISHFCCVLGVDGRLTFTK